MNYHLTCSSAILCSFLATGCATHTSTQTKKVSDSATAYTKHINKLLDTTKSHVIDMDSKNLVSSRSVSSKQDNEKKLKQNNDALEKWIAMTDQLRKQNKVLLRYFETLHKMMKTSTDNDMSEPLGDISLSISRMNQIKADQQDHYDQNRELSAPEAGQIGSLSQVLISNRYAGKVRQALIRDRDIIDRQIALQEQQLKQISSSYKRRTLFENEEHYTNQVHSAYVNFNNPDFEPMTWTQDRLKWLERKQAMNIFDDIKEANKAFREDWRNLLQGKKDASSVTAILGDINRAVDTAYQLRDSRLNPRVRTNIGVLLPK